MEHTRSDAYFTLWGGCGAAVWNTLEVTHILHFKEGVMLQYETLEVTHILHFEEGVVL